MDRKSQFTRELTYRNPPACGGTDKSIIVGGDFRECWIGIRMDALVEVLREKYAGNYQYGFQISMRADVQLAREAAFCQLTGITA